MPSQEIVRLSPHHDRIRRRGVNRWVYWSFRLLAQPAIQLFFRLRRTGREHIPDGPVILAANHRSFLDPFVIGTCLRRPIYFVAKKELFDNRLTGWFLNCLGAFPVRRGESDEDSVATALALLERGEAVVIFPEGTRHRSGPLHSAQARRRQARAAERGASRADRHHRHRARAPGLDLLRPVRVDIRCGRPSPTRSRRRRSTSPTR